MGWWDVILSFIYELRPILHSDCVLGRGLNKSLIVLHFLATCVNVCSLIKKKCINLSSALTSPNWKGDSETEQTAGAWQQQPTCNVEELWAVLFISTVFHSCEPTSPFTLCCLRPGQGRASSGRANYSCLSFRLCRRKHVDEMEMRWCCTHQLSSEPLQS